MIHLIFLCIPNHYKYYFFLPHKPHHNKPQIQLQKISLISPSCPNILLSLLFIVFYSIFSREWLGFKIEMVAHLFIYILSIIIFVFMLRKIRPERRGKLPPGSMGWPYIGETLQLYSENPNLFFASKQNRYSFLTNSIQ